LGIGDWGLGIGPNPQSPIPNPPSPIPKSPYKNIIKIYQLIFLIFFKNFKFEKYILHKIKFKNGSFKNVMAWKSSKRDKRGRYSSNI